MKPAFALFLWCGVAAAEPPRAGVEADLPPGTAMEYRPLAVYLAEGVSPSAPQALFLVERVDRRPTGSETSWMLYDRAMSLAAYATLYTDAGLSGEHVQWVGGGEAAKPEVAKLVSEARLRMAESGERAHWPAAAAKLLKESTAWQPLRALKSCPLKAHARGTTVEIAAPDAAAKRELTVAFIDAPPSPAAAKRGCAGPALDGALRCAAGAGREVLVIVPFASDCGGRASQQELVLYDPAALEPQREDALGMLAWKARDLAGARHHFEAALRADAGHDPAHFHLACMLALGGAPFAEGQKGLEPILGSEPQRLTWLPRIRTEPALARWRDDPGFPRWIGQFPVR
jgi:hypothetical protein